MKDYSNRKERMEIRHGTAWRIVLFFVLACVCFAAASPSGQYSSFGVAQSASAKQGGKDLHEHKRQESSVCVVAESESVKAKGVMQSQPRETYTSPQASKNKSLRNTRLKRRSHVALIRRASSGVGNGVKAANNELSHRASSKTSN